MTEFLSFFTAYPNIYLFLVTIISLFIGSFLNVVIYRLPRIMEQSWSEECRIYLGLKPQVETNKLSLSLPFSHCPQCKTTIRPWHNIPLLSYLFLQGRCAYCRAPISLRYPLVELLTCLCSVFIAWQWGISLATLAGLIFTWICIALTFIDFDYHILPDQLTLLLVWIGLVLSLNHVFCTPSEAIWGAITGYLIFALTQSIFGLLTGKTGMGQGDFKFLAALGAFFGWTMLPLIILLASVTGIFFTLTNMIIKQNFQSTPLPFGPYLALAGWITLLFGKNMMQTYLNLM